MCGAVTTTDAPQCQYCRAQLATVACPACFALMYIGIRHCKRCGAAAARQENVANVAADMHGAGALRINESEDARITGIASAGALLKFLLD